VDLGSIVWLLFLLLLVFPVLSHRLLDMRRARALSALQRQRGTRVIAMIHRQETVGVLGVPFYRFIDIEDSEAVLRAIRLTRRRSTSSSTRRAGSSSRRSRSRTPSGDTRPR
jgi:ClpP class serine protease